MDQIDDLLTMKEEGVEEAEQDLEESQEEQTEFSCHICSATFVTQLSLTRHMILHEDDVKKEVVVKPEADPMSNLLETILKNGSKAKPSGRPIPNLKPLPALIPTHTGHTQQTQQQRFLQQQQSILQTKNFHCPLCPQSFCKKEDLARHQSRTHGGSRFTCPYCSRNISRRDHLKRHIKNVHPEVCTQLEIGPFLTDPQASRTINESLTENFAVVQQGPLAKKRKLSPTATATNNANNDDFSLLPAFNFQQQDENEDDDGSQEYSNEEYQEGGNDDWTWNENITIEPEFPMKMDPGNFEDENDKNDQNDQQQQDDGDEYTDNSESNDMMMNNEAVNNNDDVGSSVVASNQSLLVPPERKFKCEMCDAAFMSKINMLRHMSTHSIVRPHKCNVCGKGFLRKEHLSKHLSSVHSGLKYKCQFCGKDISRKDHLFRHIRNCHPVEFSGIPPEMIDSEPQQMSQMASIDERSVNQTPKMAALACDMCPVTFHHIDELHEHQSAVHSDVRKFKCPKCPKAFKRKEHLFKHQATHTSESQKGFNCSKCGLVFPRMEEVYMHIQQVHENNVSVASKPTKQKQSLLACNLCDSTFQQRDQLVQHLKSYHGVNNPESRILHNSNTETITNTLSAGTSRNPPPEFVRRQHVQNMKKLQQQRLPQPPFRQPTASATTVSNAKIRRVNVNNNNQNRAVNQKGGSSSVQAKLQSLLGIHVPVKNKMDEGSLGSLMGLINKGSLSLSRVGS